MDRVIMDYLPQVLQTYRDYVCLMNCYQDVFNTLWGLEGEAENDMFLATTAERGIAHWEALFGIEVQESDSLEARRKQIISKLGQSTPYSWAAFLSFLHSITGEEGAIDAVLEGLQMEIRINPQWRNYEQAVLALIEQMVPANIDTSVILIYNPYITFTPMTHGEMGAYTHNQLRCEVNVF